jgi:hypothetical protein
VKKFETFWFQTLLADLSHPGTDKECGVVVTGHGHINTMSKSGNDAKQKTPKCDRMNTLMDHACPCFALMILACH